MLALIASVVGMASTLAGAHHLRLWRTETLAAAAATALIAWLLTLLAMGVACKEIHTGGYRTKRLVRLLYSFSFSRGSFPHFLEDFNAPNIVLFGYSMIN